MIEPWNSKKCWIAFFQWRRHFRKKLGAKHQAFTAICWNGKTIDFHSKRKRKKRKGVNIKREYRLEKTKVKTSQIVRSIRNKLGSFFKHMGVEIVFADNDKKLQSKAAEEAWARFGIELYPGAGQVANSAESGSPVNCPAFMPLDQSVHAAWKTHDDGLYDRWNSRRSDRFSGGCFVNDLMSSWAQMPMKKVRTAIDVQRKIHQEILASKGKRTKHDTD